jgi:opacity protein-like surface antigen
MRLNIFKNLALWTMMTGTVLAGSKDMKEIAAPEVTTTSDAGFYASVFGATVFDQDYYGKSTTTSTAASPSFTTSQQIRNAVGNGGGLKFGYDFADQNILGLKVQPAVEAEAFYLDPRIWTDSNFNYTPPTVTPPPLISEVARAGGTDPAFHTRQSGDLHAAAFFLNGILRFKTNSIVTPYFGVGVGTEYLRLDSFDISVTSNGVPLSQSNGLHDDDLCFAMQGLAGLDVQVARHWSLFTEYKYIVAVDPSFSFSNYDGAGSSDSLKADFLGQDTITAGVRYHF